MVFLHENGVISTGIFDVPNVAFVQSWYPDGLDNYGGVPYANSTEDFNGPWKIMFEEARKQGMLNIQWVHELTPTRDLYFLTKSVHESLS